MINNVDKVVRKFAATNNKWIGAFDSKGISLESDAFENNSTTTVTNTRRRNGSTLGEKLLIKRKVM